MSLLSISNILNVPYSTARRALFALGLRPARVGYVYVLSNTETRALIDYLAARAEKREAR